MKNDEIYLAKNLLNKIKNSGNNSFKLNVLLNLELVENRVKKLEEIVAPSKEIKEFQAEQRKLVFEYCEKDENGTIILYSEEDGKGNVVKGNNEKGHLNIIKDKDVFEKSMTELTEKYQEYIDNHNEKASEFSLLLQEEAKDFKLIKFGLNQLPELSFEELKIFKELDLLEL